MKTKSKYIDYNISSTEIISLIYDLRITIEKEEEITRNQINKIQEKYEEEIKEMKEKSTKQEEEINKLVGKWIPFKAEYNGEQISLRSIYGSGIEYGGELILNHNGTYTEFIGIYSEETMNDLQGTYNIYGNGEKALLKSNNGETKVLECLESSNINSNETTIVERLENGTCIYFKMQ